MEPDERLKKWEITFAKAGWFIPTYIQTRFIEGAAAEIEAKGDSFEQSDLEVILSTFYSAGGLAAMVLHRFPETPIIQDYHRTIAESVEAHFYGLPHIAVAGLIPIIEGAGRRLAEEVGIRVRQPAKMLKKLSEYFVEERLCEQNPAAGELISLVRSFTSFAEQTLYVDSAQYPFSDGTNRHGIAHGSFSDDSYGTPLNFYKVIAAIQFLTFLAAFRYRISVLAPNVSEASMRLAMRYLGLPKAQKMIDGKASELFDQLTSMGIIRT